MKEVVVLSGKGGTGKTSIMASYATIANNAVMADCDVDAPNMHLLLSPRVLEKGDFIGAKVAVIDPTRCSNCTRCIAFCRFGAIQTISMFGITKVAIDKQACEGCGLCQRICHSGAVKMEDRTIGEWYVSSTRHGKMVHALLLPGQGNSGKLVAFVKEKARKIARDSDAKLILVDGPPGIGCPVMSALSGADIAVLVTEPTRSGLSDLKRAVQLVRKFRMKAAYLTNKFDLNKEMTEELERWAAEEGVEPLGRVPYDDSVVNSMAAGKTIIEGPATPAGYSITKTYERLARLLDDGK